MKKKKKKKHTHTKKKHLFEIADLLPWVAGISGLQNKNIKQLILTYLPTTLSLQDGQLITKNCDTQHSAQFNAVQHLTPSFVKFEQGVSGRLEN